MKEIKGLGLESFSGNLFHVMKFYNLNAYFVCYTSLQGVLNMEHLFSKLALDFTQLYRLPIVVEEDEISNQSSIVCIEKTSAQIAWLIIPEIRQFQLVKI